MLNKIVRVMVVLAILVLNVVPIYADTSVTITVNLVPDVTAGITGFLITYVTDTQMDLSWGYSGTVNRIMIRAKYGAYPADIPNINTAPTDGYLVYYGNGVAVSDTSMNFDQNPGVLNYKAWGQNVDGTWEMITSSGFKESARMALIGLAIIAIALTVIGLRFRAYVVGVFGGVLWIALAYYIQANPLPNVPVGSPINTMIFVILVGCGALIGLFSVGSLFSRGDGRSFKEKAFGGGTDAQHVISHNGEWRKSQPIRNTMESRAMAYRNSIHGKLNQSKK